MFVPSCTEFEKFNNNIQHEVFEIAKYLCHLLFMVYYLLQYRSKVCQGHVLVTLLLLLALKLISIDNIMMFKG